METRLNFAVKPKFSLHFIRLVILIHSILCPGISLREDLVNMVPIKNKTPKDSTRILKEKHCDFGILLKLLMSFSFLKNDEE